MTSFEIIRAALAKKAYDDRDDDAHCANPTPEYQTHMTHAIIQIEQATDIDALAAVEWVQGQAALVSSEHTEGMPA